jgi:phosphoadenosine phosphosulfate reductase
MDAVPIDLAATNAWLKLRSPADVMDWAATTFGDTLVMSSSFGAESAALLHLVTKRLPDIRVIMIDTGFLFPETHQFMESLRWRMNLNVWIYRTKQDPFGYLERAGETNPMNRTDVASCCAVNKNEPFERAIRELKPRAWIRGIRKQQAITRENREIVEWSERYNCYAISPLLNWSTREIHHYMKQHDLPWHPLYEKGYASIGCNPLSCTRPVQIGEDPRAGRWSGHAKVECGLHLEVR